MNKHFNFYKKVFGIELCWFTDSAYHGGWIRVRRFGAISISSDVEPNFSERLGHVKYAICFGHKVRFLK